MLSYIFLLFINTLAIGLIVGGPYWQEYKRSKIRKLPFKKTWRQIIKRRMPFFQKMPADLQLQLKQHIQVFLAEKKFLGYNGITITDEIRVTIAAQACLLLLNRRTNYYPKLTTILVYPRAFMKQHYLTNADGVQTITNTALAGESWEFGKIVLSWQDIIDGAKVPDDGRNVVIHEFAHQLDQENGVSNGAPILGKNQSYESWSVAFSAQFEALQHEARSGTPSIFDYYGATNPAEFFAVATEVFFEKSLQLSREHPKLYEQLSEYYRVNPAIW